MGRFLVSAILTAFAVWVTTLIVPGVDVIPFAGEPPYNLLLTLLVIGIVIGLVNALLAPILKFLSIPLYILTLGLWAFILNAFLLWLAAWLTSFFGWGLTIESFWWDAIWGALVLGLVNWLVGLVARIVGAK